MNNIQTTIRKGVLEIETFFTETRDKPESIIHLDSLIVKGIITESIAEDKELFVENVVNTVIESMENIVTQGDIDESNVKFSEKNNEFKIVIENIFTNPCTKSEFEEYISDTVYALDEMYEDLYENLDDEEYRKDEEEGEEED